MSVRKFKPSFNDFVVHENHAYGLDGGMLACVDLRSGERVWKSGRYGGGQVLLLADQGALIVVSEQGEAALVEAKPQAPGEVYRFQALDGKSWSHPTVVGDRLYLRNTKEMVCYQLRLP
jgi:outer membrane protein assembly factor BamB